MAKATAGLRDRIIELRRVRAGDLKPHPDNWRIHPDRQRAALDDVLGALGIADGLLTYTDADGELVLIDGHLRQSRDPNQTWPVLVTDLTEAEARLLLEVKDPIAAMAATNNAALEKLLHQTEQDALAGVVEFGAHARATIEELLGKVPGVLPVEGEEAEGGGSSSRGGGGEDWLGDHDLAGMETSHIRLVQLFLNTETQPELVRLARALEKPFETDNLTDTVVEAVRYAHAQLVAQPE